MISPRIGPSLAVLMAFALTCAGADGVPETWQTVAEATDFQATSSYHETIEFLKRIDAASDDVLLEYFGRSGSGRLLPLAVVSADGAFTPEEAASTNKPILLLQSCIHAGEVDGKDATLMILRDMVLGRIPIPRNTILLFVPIFNVDGHERVSKYNRPNQDGPADGMGFRTTANGINLNRDYMRAATVEMRGLLDLVNRWRPHLHVDNHVTDGSDHAWVVTWMVAEAPVLAAPIDRWLDTTIPEVMSEVRSDGYPAGPYVDLKDPLDPSKGFAWLDPSPRLSTDYFPLRNRPSILIEMHAHKPFKQRVLANRSFMVHLIGSVDQRPGNLVASVVEAEADTVRLGGPDAEPSHAVLRWRSSGRHETVSWPAARWMVEPSLVTGAPQLRFEYGSYQTIQVPWYHGHTAELLVPRPRGYLILPGWPQVERMLDEHGLVARRLREPVELEVETIRVSDPVLADAPYQGTTRVERFEVSRQIETREVPAGAVWVPANQPDFEVAVQLFEPEAPDSMLRWGMLNTVFEPKTYIGRQTLEDIARRLVVDDTVSQAWDEALTDPAFASDPRARYLWWYARTPFYDEQLGLLPTLRVMFRPDFAAATAP